MADTHNETDILIIGAGPVGLFLANECARRGLRWRLVEANASQTTHSKALAIFSRTLEIFDMAGVVAPFLAEANRVTSVAVVSHQHRLAHVRFAPDESAYPFIAMVPQNVTERVLVEQLHRKGGAVEYETKLVTAKDQGDHVSVVLERHGQRVEVNCAFVVGCDGAHSTVRHLLQLPFVGEAYEDSFMLADVETNDAMPADELQLCPSEFGPVAIFPISATRRRIVATITHPEGDAPSIDLVQRILRQRAPAGIEAHAVHWSSYFRIHHRHTPQLRVGRMFIAGDAAHIHSPFGGQGMNTGLQDVWNLVWKLDWFLSGRGDERLLDSYAAERLPVIRHVIETTHRITRVMGTGSGWAQTLRDVMIPVVSHFELFQHAFVERLSELDIAYDTSATVENGGNRYFDDSLRGGAGIRDRFLLLCGVDVDAAVDDTARELADAFTDVLEVRRSNGSGMRLVRPDGYIAYKADALAGDAALRSVRLFLDRLTGRDGHAWLTRAG